MCLSAWDLLARCSKCDPWPATSAGFSCPLIYPQSKAQAEKADLMNRLNNAVAQRNAAREEALMLEAKLKQLQVGGWEAGPSKPG